MAVITLLSAKCAPGVSTAAAALAYTWPRPVILADCDPGGGDLDKGWLGHWLIDGGIGMNCGLLSYATATRHAAPAEPGDLQAHVQVVPVAPHAQLLRGLDGPTQHTAIGAAGWQRLAHALRALSDSGHADVLVDVGRYGAGTPRPLVGLADVTLLAVRPLARHVLAAGQMIGELARWVEPARLNLAVLATTTAGTRDVRKAIGYPVGLELPDDPRTACVFSDGANAGEPTPRSPLTRAAASASARLSQVLNMRPAPPPPTEAAVARAAEAAQATIGGPR